MGVKNSDQYSMKHLNRTVDPIIASTLEKEVVIKNANKTVSCQKIHEIAQNLRVEPKDVGIQADLMKLRIKECQLGLFGHEPNGKNFNIDVEISEELNCAIQNITKDSRITCIKCWEIASKFGIERLDVGSVCEKLGIKIKYCQLNAF
ncbi:MAG: hypothetical protein HQK72_15675 [Desulfamplus sp.]|nr:hypothetical protein [Desulfamplus sp.]